MKIMITSIFVNDQEKALAFYTQKLGFVLKQDMPAGDYRWLTLVSPEDAQGVELLLEPNQNQAASEYQQKIYQQGIPAIMFGVDDVPKEYERLRNLDVKFTTEPTNMGNVTIAVLDDTCGNLIQIAQMN